MRTHVLFGEDYCLLEILMLKRRIVEASNGPLTEIQGYIIDSCLARKDLTKAKQMIEDWNTTRARTQTKRDVSKWIPGDHFYALDRKFRTLEEAIEHLEMNGFVFGTLQERFHYRENGG